MESAAKLVAVSANKINGFKKPTIIPVPTLAPKSDRYPSEIPSCYTVVNIKPHHNSNEIAQMK